MLPMGMISVKARLTHIKINQKFKMFKMFSKSKVRNSIK